MRYSGRVTNEPTRSPAGKARDRIRAGEWTETTASLAPGFVQANLVVLPEALSTEFETYCRVNPRALPLLEVTEPGSPVPTRLAPSADLRTDLPRYRVYRNGTMIEEPTDIVTLWHADFVAFLIGCSFTFDSVLEANGVAVRHQERGRNVPMYVTTEMTEPSGAFSGPLVVSMRPIRREDVDRTIELTRSMPWSHGEPIQIGSSRRLGIDDLGRPDYGDPVTVEDGEIPVFWPCGVTAQAAAAHSKTPLMISHAPGHMFITDLRAGAASNAS
jgi:uncharacterized protein YcsI (UPF0317 family)